MRGVVIKSTGSWYHVKGENAAVIECRIKGKFRMEGSKNTNPIAVGDIVDYELEIEVNKGIITGLEPRRNYIIRKSTNLSKQSHIIAANIDHAFLLVTTALPRTSTGFIDRFLVTAEAYGIPVSIVFSKSDIYDTTEKLEMDQLKKIYENIGYTCYEVSSLKGSGMELLKKAMKGKTSMLSGHSGVGKSSLINALGTLLSQRTGNLSVAHGKGIHTTTFAELFDLPSGGAVIDTPGIKEFGIFDIQREELCHFFPEMRSLFNKCRYNSCLHLSEMQCAVKNAVEAEKIAVSRYNTYVGIMTGNELDVKY